MTGRRPYLAGARRMDRVVRKVRWPAQYGEDCSLCWGPMACDQLVTIPQETIGWVHLGCQVYQEKQAAGQQTLF